jgi:hypothetical protein
VRERARESVRQLLDTAKQDKAPRG